MKKQLISIIVPVFNEEKNLPILYNEMENIFSELNYLWEIIFINDGSEDNSWQIIQKLSQHYKIVKGINFSRNFGHPSALQAGLETATGEAIIMMDADLQHPPKVIKLLIKKWEEGYQIVNSIRQSTEGINFFKKVTTKIFYALINTFSSLKINEGEADFRLIDKKVLKIINQLPEAPKFYRGIVNWIGFRVANIFYQAPSRKYGTSSFTPRKMFELARLGLTAFSMKPLKLIIGIGLIMSCLSFLGLMVMLYFKLLVSYQYFSNNVILSTLILFTTGLLITSQGIVALYLIDIYHASKGRPSYIIADLIGFKGKKND